MTKRANFGDKYEQNGRKIKSTSKTPVRTQFPDAIERRAVLKRIKGDALRRIEGGRKLRNSVDDAEKSSEAYLRFKESLDTAEFIDYHVLRQKQLNGTKLSNQEKKNIKSLDDKLEEPRVQFFKSSTELKSYSYEAFIEVYLNSKFNPYL